MPRSMFRQMPAVLKTVTLKPIMLKRILASCVATAALLAGLGTAQADEKVTYLFPAPSFLTAFAPFQLAQARGYYAKEGVEVTFQTGRGGADTAKQVAVGNADMGGGVGDTSMIVRANGLPVRAVALLGSHPLFKLGVRHALGVKSLKELAGKKVGVIAFQDSSYYALLGVIANSGLTKGDVEIQAVGNAGMTQLPIAGSLDAGMFTPEWGDEIQTAGVALDLFDIEAVFPSMAQAILTSDKTAKERPAAVRGFVHAVLHAVQDIVDDPAKAAHDYVAAVPQQAGKEEQVTRVLRLYGSQVYQTSPVSDLGKFDPKRLAMVQKFYIDNNIVQTAVPIDDLYTNEFVGH